MNKQMLKQMISNELDLLFKTDHWGTEDQITIENIILAKSGMEPKYHAFDAATGSKAHINAPLLHEGLDILTGRGAAMDQIFADIKADATGANHRNARTDGRA